MGSIAIAPALLDWTMYLTDVFNSPNNSGLRIATVAAIVHGTMGGHAIGTEYNIARDMFNDPASLVSANLLIGYDGRVDQPMGFDLAAWHALSPANEHYLGVELEMPNLTTPYSDIQYELLASWLVDMAGRYAFPLSRPPIIGHSEEPNGILQGKRDPGPLFDWARLFTIIRERTEPPVVSSLFPILLGVGMIAAGGYLVLRKSQLGL